jgi:magnesium transporter
MSFFRNMISNKAGMPPGTLIHIGERKAENIRLSIIDYDEKGLEEKELKTIEESFIYKDKPSITWINIDGLHDVEIIAKIGNEFDLHPLIMEDILHTNQRPKMEDFENYLFIVIRMLYYDKTENEIISEQLSLILWKNLVISFQESSGGIFEPVKERLRKDKGRIRKMGPDFLLYALMDTVVDNYLIVLENINERVEELEEELISRPEPGTLEAIHNFKRELIFLKKSLWPLRDLIGILERGESELIQEKTTVYFKDVYDHTIHMIDTVETYRDLVSGMMEVFLTSISNRMNEVMKMLTIIATIFIPLTFIAGVYGMNFNYMPELSWRYGYFMALLIMLMVGIVMLIWFKRKNFL